MACVGSNYPIRLPDPEPTPKVPETAGPEVAVAAKPRPSRSCGTFLYIGTRDGWEYLGRCDGPPESRGG